ncbi:SOS response-associated peptidase [Sphingomonas sp. GCM10030256]|uniref:SOS response-associated peptidase n=1 Tax=Sphingomonas sp. GCM10030256 TaxID=3273427 RepID=UPI00361395A3
MCNLYRLETPPDAIRQMFGSAGLPLDFPEGVPNLEPREVRITDRAPIVRVIAGSPELVERRWSWPGPGGKPVYNFRSDGREFPQGRCLVLADGFYEYTAAADPKAKRKNRWLFTPAGDEPFAIAGLVRDDPGVGEAFTLLTTAPGPDVEPYHHRQVAVLPPQHWREWLDHQSPAGDLLRPCAPGSLRVQAA